MHIQFLTYREYKARLSASDIGKKVQVQGYSCPGTLRFYGNHHKTGLLRCGVELDQPEGKNNGCIQGHQYFTCDPNYGILCTPAKVTIISEE